MRRRRKDARHTSANSALGKLIEARIESSEAEKNKFFELADKFSASSDPAERKRIKEALANMTLGEK